MSEKKLRKAIERYRNNHDIFVSSHTGEECWCEICADARDVLAADPDVVVLAKEFLRDHTLTDEFGVHWITLEYEIFEAILETQFHIRLTEDDSKGVCYEWVDDDA